MRITVLGAGSWGTALARQLSLGNHQIVLWAHRAEQLEQIKAAGENRRYLPGIGLPRDWAFEPDMRRAAEQGECLLVAVPSKAFREVAMRLPDRDEIVVSVTKGIEAGSGLTMCGILSEVCPRATGVALSGPTFAREVARENPTAIVAGSWDTAAAQIVQKLFHCQTFRVYTTSDRLGVELGGALKNVMAIAAGVCDGLGFGDNSKAALVTRAIAEMRRMGVGCGAQAETFSGLSGLGDLTVTCFSRQSRNRALGERLGHGEPLEEILRRITSVAEGYPTARSAYQLARKLDVTTPIIDEVYAMLYEGKDVRQAVRDLTSRDSKAED